MIRRRVGDLTPPRSLSLSMLAALAIAGMAAIAGEGFAASPKRSGSSGLHAGLDSDAVSSSIQGESLVAAARTPYVPTMSGAAASTSPRDAVPAYRSRPFRSDERLTTRVEAQILEKYRAFRESLSSP